MSDSSVDVSIITSLYRSANYLSGFLDDLKTCLEEAERQGFAAEAVIVANAPDRRERRLLAPVLESPWWRCRCRVLKVARETLYASWNRGIRSSSGGAIAFWNADDYRNPAAIIEGIELVRTKPSIVWFPWLYVSVERRLHPGSTRAVILNDRRAMEELDPRSDFCLGPFFMIAREVCDLCGLFDEQFHIAGDYDWQLRAVAKSGFLLGERLGGAFFVDGANLSAAATPRLHVEQNVIFLRHGVEHRLWALDRRARALFDSYRIPWEPASSREADWSFEGQWKRSHLPARAYRRGRKLAEVLRRRLGHGTH